MSKIPYRDCTPCRYFGSQASKIPGKVLRKRPALSHPDTMHPFDTRNFWYTLNMKQPFSAKKSLGQNFLINPKVAENIAKAAEIVPGDTVLEVGPGTGMLTRALLKEGARVVAIEADIRAVEVLKGTFEEEIENGSLTLIHGDIRTTPLKSLPLPKTYKVAANIPYYLSGMLFEMMLSSNHQPSTLVFLVQKEVAERTARSKKESILSLSVKAYGTPSYRGTVTKGNFRPQPKVDSAILRISSISKDSFKKLDETAFFTVLKTGFSARRKHLLGNLSALIPREELQRIFIELSIPLDVRGEYLSIETWLSLAELVSLSPQLKGSGS